MTTSAVCPTCDPSASGSSLPPLGGAVAPGENSTGVSVDELGGGGGIRVDELGGDISVDVLGEGHINVDVVGGGGGT